MTHKDYSKELETMLTDYVAGRLSPAKHGLVTEFQRLSSVAANDVALEETLASQLLEESEGESLSANFFDRVSAAIAVLPNLKPEQGRREDITNYLDSVKWRTRLPGISTHDIIGGRKGEGDRLFLLKVKPGFTIWDHSHSGDEWVLVLKGSYMSGGKLYEAGALHLEDADTEHALTASNDQDCICLVMTQGPVKMASTLGQVLSPLVGL